MKIQVENYDTHLNFGKPFHFNIEAGHWNIADCQVNQLMTMHKCLDQALHNSVYMCVGINDILIQVLVKLLTLLSALQNSTEGSGRLHVKVTETPILIGYLWLRLLHRPV